MKIFKKKFLEQITAAVLSSTISVSCVPMGVFAEESSSVSVETSDTLTEASQSELSETQISDTSPSSEPVSDTSDSQTDISTETESQDSSETPATSEETSVSESEGPIDEPQPVPDTYNIILNDLPEEIRAAYDIYINGMTENITVTKNKPFSIEIIPNGLSERTYQISNLKFGTYYPGGAIGQSSFSSKMTALSEMADENGNIFVNLEFSPVYIVSFNYNPEYGTIEGDIINDENPAGTVYIKGGQSIEFTAVPNENYRVSKVVIDGEEQSFTENDYIYECSSLTADRDYTIEIVFALNTFSVSSQTSGNGTVLSLLTLF